MDIGLVLEGGGGKGAYEVGVWRALRELRIEEHIKVVSGTSVGALNAALFLQGNLERAEDLWLNISPDQVLHGPLTSDDAFFTQDGLTHFICQALADKSQRKRDLLCYATCRREKDGLIRAFELSSLLDPGYVRRILLASSAIPAIFPAVELNGEKYIDGGVNGDNTPIRPVYDNRLPVILVVHLGPGVPTPSQAWPGAEITDLFPSQSLGNLLSGTLNFDPRHARACYDLGYQDAIEQLKWLARRLEPYVPPESPALDLEPLELPIQTAKIEREDPDMEKIQFQDPALQKQYDTRIAQLEEIASSPALTTPILWDATAARYAETIAKVKKLLSQEELKADRNDRLDKQMEAFLNKCEKAEFHIALVGAVKAGKSSLINALLDDELASTKVTPETASLTKFCASDEGDYVQITFYDAQEWDVLWASAQEAKTSKFMGEFQEFHADQERDKWVGHDVIRTGCATREQLRQEIKKWTSSQSATHYFVKEVKVGVRDFPLPTGVVLVDTPGLNDAVQYRSDITSNYIDRANAVLVCVKADALTGPELLTISSVFHNTRYNPEKVYIIATQQDTLNDPESDWIEQRKVWLRHLKGEGYFNSLELAQCNLIPTSGYFYTLLKNYETLGENDKFKLWSSAMKFHCQPDDLPDRYDELLAFTGIEKLLGKLKTEIVSKHKKLLIEDIKGGYAILKENLTALLKAVSERQQTLVEASEKSNSELQQIRQEAEEKLAAAEKDREEVKDLTEEMGKQMKEQKSRLTKAIKSLGGKKS